MKIHIIEPYLRNNAGHSYEWTKKLAEYYNKKLGFEVVIYSNFKIEDNVLSKLSNFAKVKPIFKSNIEFKPKKNIRNFRVYLSILLRLKKIKFNEDDYYIIPTLTPLFLFSLMKYSSKKNIVAIIHNEPNKKNDNFWNKISKKIQESKSNILFFTTTQELIEVFSKLLKKEIFLVPYLYDKNYEKVQKEEFVLKKVAFIGHQREEKGLLFLPELVNLLLQSRVKVVVQDSKNDVKLSKNNNLEILNYIDNMSDLIKDCDLIIAPYDYKTYTYRLSGVVIDALANGKPVIAPKNTSCGNLVKSFNAGELFDEFNAKSVFEAFLKVKQNYEFYSKKSLKAGEYFDKNHGLENFANALLIK